MSEETVMCRNFLLGNEIPKNWIWLQKHEVQLREHSLIPLVAPEKVFRCPKKPPEDFAKFWPKIPLPTFYSIGGPFLHQYASVIPFWKAETKPSMVLMSIWMKSQWPMRNKLLKIGYKFFLSSKVQLRPKKFLLENVHFYILLRNKKENEWNGAP